MKQIIVTISEMLFDKIDIKDIHSNHNLYRINGAHNDSNDTKNLVRMLRKEIPNANILLDLPGNKIRTANLSDAIPVRKNEAFTISSHITNLPTFHMYLQEGNTVFADDSTLEFLVQSIEEDNITFLSRSNGSLKPKKGLHIKGISKNFPFLLAKDLQLIETANELELSHVGLSFVRTAEDILLAKKLLSQKCTIIAKVETNQAVQNLDSILETVDHILIDRGDLSTEIGLYKVPTYQNYIIDRALFYNKRVFLATQFLKNMLTNPIPSIAEVIDLYHSFKTGIAGVQLSEETAVGDYPAECLHAIQMVIEAIRNEKGEVIS